MADFDLSRPRRAAKELSAVRVHLRGRAPGHLESRDQSSVLGVDRQSAKTAADGSVVQPERRDRDWRSRLLGSALAGRIGDARQRARSAEAGGPIHARHAGHRHRQRAQTQARRHAADLRSLRHRFSIHAHVLRAGRSRLLRERRSNRADGDVSARRFHASARAGDAAVVLPRIPARCRPPRRPAVERSRRSRIRRVRVVRDVAVRASCWKF